MVEPTVYCAYTEIAPTDKIKPNIRNMNVHPPKQIKLLAHIIQAAGWRAPITVSKRSGLVVRGHARLEAAKLLGCTVCPVDYQEYGGEEAEIADMIADNKIQELSNFNVLGLKLGGIFKRQRIFLGSQVRFILRRVNQGQDHMRLNRFGSKPNRLLELLNGQGRLVLLNES